jgi:hypothetical protein
MQGPNLDLDSIIVRSWLMGGSGPLGGVDWLTLLALLVVGTLYFLAPVFGYRAGNRGLLLASLWVLLGKMGLALLRVCIIALELLDRPRVTGSASKTTTETLFVLMSVFETGLFVLGIVLFVIGLSALRREMDLPRVPRGFRDD